MSGAIQGLWIGPTLSKMERLSINSFLKNGHDYHLYTYGPVDGVPSGTVLKDGNEIFPSSRIFQYRDFKSYAGFANFFRYKLLLERGGWWADLDVICIKYFDFETDYVFASEQWGGALEKTTDAVPKLQEVVTNGIIKAPKDSEVMSYALRVCHSKNPQELKWGETGPQLLHSAVHKFSLRKYVKSAETFCPIAPYRFFDAVMPGRCLDFGETTYAVHLWHEYWRRYDIDKEEVYVSNCLYEKLKAAYL